MPTHRDAKLDVDAQTRGFGPAAKVVSTVTARSPALTGLFVLALLYTAYIAKAVLVCIALAVLLMLMLAPFVRFTKRRLHLPQSITAAALVLCLFLGVTSSFYAVSTPAVKWMDELPRVMLEVEWKLRPLQKPVEEVKEAAKTVEKATRGSADGDPEKPVPVVVEGPSLTDTLLGQTKAIIAGVLVMFVLLFFLLSAGDTILRRVVESAPNRREKDRLIEIVRRMEEDISY